MNPEYKKIGFNQKVFGIPTKRYCQTLELKNQPELIKQYIKYHSEPFFWPEIKEGLQSVGILEMEIYLLDNRLFMIVETPIDFDWDVAFEQLNRLPRQAEWEAFVAAFQQSTPGATSSEKWKLMDRIFHIYD